jgi:colanic acid/amylovoran biosynthesis protein
MQGMGWKECFAQLKRRRVKGKPFFLLGCNFGPYTEEEFYHKYKELFSTYEDVCFRDTYSYNMFKGLINVRFADDILFGIKFDKTYYTKKRIAISVVGMSDRGNLRKYEYAYNHKISQLCEFFVDKDYDVVLVSFCKPEGDEKAINDILALIDAKHIDKVKKHFYRGDIDRVLKVLAESKYIIATRFHSMILGWVMGKPVFPIVYSDKMKHVIYDTGFVGDYLNVQNIDELMPERVLSALELNNVFDVSTQIANSEKQFEKLDEFSK